MDEKEYELKKREQDLAHVVNIRAQSMNFAKFFLGTVCLGLLGAITNYQIHITQLRLSEREQQREYVSKFVAQALDANLEKRYQFAHYFCKLLGDNWVLYFDDISKEMDRVKNEIASKQATIAHTEAAITAAVDKAVAASDSTVIASLAPKLAETQVLRQEVAIMQQQVTPTNAPPVVCREPAAQPAQTGWLYVGKRADNKWSEKTLDTQEIPSAGDVCKVTTRVYLRDSKPIDIGAGEAQLSLGKVVDVVHPGKKVLVRNLWTNLTTGSVWIEAEVQQ